MAMDRLVAWFKISYDKLLAVVVLSILIVSLLYLAIKIGMVKAQEKQWQSEIVNLVPQHPVATGVNSEQYKVTMARLETPHTIAYGGWSRRFIVPEERFACEDCKYPNTMEAVICVSCGKKLETGVVTEALDSDGDGINDLAEIRYGLDPYNPADALLDSDGDGFSNLIEHIHGTDPRDPDSFPPIEIWIRVEKVEADVFNLLFKAYSTLPGDEKVFQLNTRDVRKTHFVKLGDTIEEFTVVGFETNFVQVTKPIKRTIDESRLTLKQADREIVLTMGKAVQWDMFIATLIYEINNKKFRVRKGDEFELEGNKYTVNSIDTVKEVVVITKVSDGKVFELNKDSVGLSGMPAAADVQATAEIEEQE